MRLRPSNLWPRLLRTLGPFPGPWCSQWAGPPQPWGAGQGAGGAVGFNEAPLGAQRCRLSASSAESSSPVCPPNGLPPCPGRRPARTAPPQPLLTPILSRAPKVVLQLLSPGVGLGGLQPAPRQEKRSNRAHSEPRSTRAVQPSARRCKTGSSAQTMPGAPGAACLVPVRADVAWGVAAPWGEALLTHLCGSVLGGACLGSGSWVGWALGGGVTAKTLRQIRGAEQASAPELGGVLGPGPGYRLQWAGQTASGRPLLAASGSWWGQAGHPRRVRTPIPPSCRGASLTGERGPGPDQAPRRWAGSLGAASSLSSGRTECLSGQI